MDICFVFTPIQELLEERLEPPMGLLYLATYLNSHGLVAGVRDLSGTALDAVELPFADWYGFSTYSPTYQRTLAARDIALRINPKAKTIAGGPHASALPNEVARDFDYVVLDEAETAVLQLLRGETPSAPILDFTPTRDRATMTSNRRIIQGTPIGDLDSLPFPDYDLVDVKSYTRVVDGRKSLSVLSSRGCPFKCEFCNSKIMGGGTRIRYRTPTNVVQEIEALRTRYGVEAFRFQDDIFGLDTDWLRRFTFHAKPLAIRYRAFVRVHQCALPGFSDLLVEGGCRHVSLGIESGSDRILRSMVKGQSVKTGFEGIARAKEAGLRVRIYLIVGYPGETWATIEETVEFVRQSRPDEIAVYPFVPYPGTPLYYSPEEHGIFNMDRDFSKYFQVYGDRHSHFVYDLRDHDRAELQRMKEYLVAQLDSMRVTWSHQSPDFHSSGGGGR